MGSDDSLTQLLLKEEGREAQDGGGRRVTLGAGQVSYIYAENKRTTHTHTHQASILDSNF